MINPREAPAVVAMTVITMLVIASYAIAWSLR